MKSQKPSRVTQTIERNMMDFKGGKTGYRMSSCFTVCIMAFQIDVGQPLHFLVFKNI